MLPAPPQLFLLPPPPPPDPPDLPSLSGALSFCPPPPVDVIVEKIEFEPGLLSQPLPPPPAPTVIG